MQIVILGNGFDLANGLPTSYEKFFEWRMEQIEGDLRPLLELYAKLLMKEIAPASYIGTQHHGDYALKKIQVILDGVSYTYYDIHRKLKEIMQNLHENGTNYLDMYFYIAKSNAKKFKNWCDVENELVAVLSTVQSMHNTSEQILEALSLPSGYRTQSKRHERILKIFFTIFIECASERSPQLNKTELVKTELLAFEKIFKKYISSIYKTVLLNTDYRNVYCKNFQKLTSNEITHLLNFNYTSLTNALQPPVVNLVEINVHGRYDGDIILGIEQMDCTTDDDFIFSKTYRKIENYSVPQPLPSNKASHVEAQTIIFYGHSLSTADYSYFQSLFDLYDIYNQTTLIFKYSIYNETERSTIAGKTFQSVTKLLKKYGTTMNNVEHGKNLTHKLLLEGRLKLEEITLEDMRFAFPPSQRV